MKPLSSILPSRLTTPEIPRRTPVPPMRRGLGQLPPEINEMIISNPEVARKLYSVSRGIRELALPQVLTTQNRPPTLQEVTTAVDNYVIPGRTLYLVKFFPLQPIIAGQAGAEYRLLSYVKIMKVDKGYTYRVRVLAFVTDIDSFIIHNLPSRESTDLSPLEDFITRGYSIINPGVLYHIYQARLSLVLNIAGYAILRTVQDIRNFLENILRLLIHFRGADPASIRSYILDILYTLLNLDPRFNPGGGWISSDQLIEAFKRYIPVVLSTLPSTLVAWDDQPCSKYQFEANEYRLRNRT